VGVRAKRVGLIRKKNNRLVIIIKDGPKYFVSIKALEGVLDGTKDMTPLWGYPATDNE